MNLSLPSGSDQLLAWAWLLLGWVLAQYVSIPAWLPAVRRVPEPILRAIAAGGLALLAVDGDVGDVALVLLLAAGASALFSWQRDWAAKHKLTALWELGVPALFVLLAAAAIAGNNIEPSSWLPALEADSGTMLYPVLVAAAIVYSWEGGSRIVVGILTSVAITTDDKAVIDSEAASRGEVIGRLERFALIVLVSQGAFTALAFLIAAKGFVRSKEFDENRDFAEYFLIGTLVSLILGLMLGIGVAALT